MRSKDLQAGVVVVHKASSNYGRYDFYQIRGLYPEKKPYYSTNKYPEGVDLDLLISKVKVTPLARGKKRIEYTKVTHRTVLGGYKFKETDVVLSEFELYYPGKKYEEVVYDSDYGSDSDSDYDSDPYSDYDRDSDLMRSNMEAGDIVVKKLSTKDGEYEFYRIKHITSREFGFRGLEVEKKYYPLADSGSMKIEYKMVPKGGMQHMTVETDVVLSDYEVYDQNKKYEVVIHDAAICDYAIVESSDSDLVEKSDPVRNNMEIGEIVVKKQTVKNGEYDFYRIGDINKRNVFLSGLGVEKNCYPLSGSDKMKIEYKMIPNTRTLSRFVEKDVLFSDYEAYDPNKKYEVVICDVVVRDYNLIKKSESDSDPLRINMKI